MKEKNIVNMFKALGDEKRLQILKMLQGGEKCACRLLEELNFSQPTLSHHMKLLCDSGIVDYRKEGKWMHYSISDEGRERLHSIIDDYLNADCGISRCCKED